MRKYICICHMVLLTLVRISVRGSNQVCRLLKALYGLKRAARKWFAKLSTALISFGYTQSRGDYSLFTKQTTRSFIVIVVYVDDMVITGDD